MAKTIRRTRLRVWAVVGVAALVGGALTACSSGGAKSSSGNQVTDDASATLLVWTDSTRQAGFEQYQKEHPGVKMKIETYDPSSLLTKIQLFNRTGSGWPDVVFDENPNDVASLSSNLFDDYPANLSALVPQSVQQGFGTTNTACTVNGALDCLKNDLAQDVLWYNKSLMTKFGYQVPTTWVQYEQLGLELVKQHPGYIIGALGYQSLYDDYLWSSGCPLADVTGPNEVHINTSDPKCTRVVNTLDPLLAAGAVSRDGPFDPPVIKLGQEQKILMMPAANWFGDFVFQPSSSYNTPNGVLAAAPMPTWSGESTNWSGAQGGGIYLVSRHSKNLKGAAAIAQWMATDISFQKSSPTYPAYGPAAAAWGQRLATDKFYAVDPFSVIQQQANLINPATKPTRYTVEQAVDDTIVQSIKGGGTMASGMAGLQSELNSLAQSVGYAVSTS